MKKLIIGGMIVVGLLVVTGTVTKTALAEVTQQETQGLVSTTNSGQVLGIFSSADKYAQAAVIKAQLAVLIRDLIKILESHMVAASLKAQ